MGNKQMSYHTALLQREDSLDKHEIGDLHEWLAELKSDVALFGDTPQDNARIAQIEARIALEVARAARRLCVVSEQNDRA